MSQAQLVPYVRHRLRQQIAFAVLFLLLSTLVFVILRGQVVAKSSADEMIAFNHRKHVAAGAQCVFCHPGVLNGPVASLPSLAKCVGCHQNVQVTSERGEITVAGSGQAGVDILMRHCEEEHLCAGKRPTINPIPSTLPISLI